MCLLALSLVSIIVCMRVCDCFLSHLCPILDKEFPPFSILTTSLCSQTLPVSLCWAFREREGEVKGQDKLCACACCVCTRIRVKGSESESDIKRHNKEHFCKKQSCDSPVRSADSLETLVLSSPLAYSGLWEAFLLV